MKAILRNTVGYLGVIALSVAAIALAQLVVYPGRWVVEKTGNGAMRLMDKAQTLKRWADAA